MNEHYRATVRHFNTAASIDSAPDEAPMFGARCVSSPEDWVGDDHAARAASAIVCIGCPVRRECAQAALDGEEEHHVWAGVDLTMELKAAGRSKLQQVVDGVEPPPARRVWTDAEDDLIRDVLTGSPEETAAAKAIGVSVHAVRMRRREMRFTRPRQKPWTDAEDAMIIAGEPASEVAKLHGRSESPIHRRRAYLRSVGRL